MSTNIIKKLDKSVISLAINGILWLFLLVTVIAVFVAFWPRMPGAGMDPSWIFGMNQAVVQGLSFGENIIFTFGPYASLYTQTYHPDIDIMMVGCSLYLALSYWGCLLLLMDSIHWRWVLVFSATLAGVLYFRDPLLFSFPLIVGLSTFKILLSGDKELTKSKFTPFLVVFIFAPFGLLSLVKGTLLILCGAITILCSVFFVINKQRKFAMICLLTPIVSMFFFWMMSGQSAAILPKYFIGMAHIVSGYTEAMALDGKVEEIFAFLIASLYLLISIVTQKQYTHSSKLFLFLTYFLFLFISFKSGFVRHDAHAIIAGTSILISALLLPFVFNNKNVLPVVFCSVFVCFFIDNHHVINFSTDSIRNNLRTTYTATWHGIKDRMEDKNWPEIDFDSSVNYLRKLASFRVMQGSTDIYSYNQSFLISSGNSWSPRPVFQSYSAYTPALAEANRKHLKGSQAPDNIIFKVEPIDGRIPAIEDGASWPTLMLNYRPDRMENDFLFLHKKTNKGIIQDHIKLETAIHYLGESVDLPPSDLPVFAQIYINPTLLGRIVSIFFKPSQLKIVVELRSGKKKQFRIIAGMSKSGFLISPLIESTAEFGMLYGEKEFLNEKVVKSISIAPRNGETILWNNEYTIVFSQISTGDSINISGIYKFDGFDD